MTSKIALPLIERISRNLTPVVIDIEVEDTNISWFAIDRKDANKCVASNVCKTNKQLWSQVFVALSPTYKLADIAEAFFDAINDFQSCYWQSPETELHAQLCLKQSCSICEQSISVGVEQE